MKPKMMRGAEFKKYFDGVVNAVLTTEGARGETISILDVMKEQGQQMPDLPKPLADKIMPLLETNLQEIRAKRGISGARRGNDCAVCSACTACVLCLELNEGAGAASIVGIVGIAD